MTLWLTWRYWGDAMLINMVLPGAVAAEEPFAFEYSGNFTDNRDADGKGTVRLNTSGTLTVLSGKATVSVYILGGGSGAAFSVETPQSKKGVCASGGSGGYQTVEVELAPGTYEIVIGVGGESNYDWDATTGEHGGNTTAFGYTSTGGSAARADYWDEDWTKAGTGGSPNGKAGAIKNGTNPTCAGGSPNGGGVVSGTVQNGGDGYVELTFI